MVILDVRNQYALLGVDNYYQKNSDTYKNPHEPIIRNLLQMKKFKGKILDMCCGSGEVTLAIENEYTSIIGSDKYTYKQYKRNTNNECLILSFKDIVEGKLNDYKFDSIICSFALHLCDLSMLPILLYQLSLITPELIILTPHKRPYINEDFWHLESEIKQDKVRMRTYTSNVFKK